MTDETRNIPLQERPYNPNPGLLEQLNLPPKAITFIRQNARNLQIGAITLLVVGLAVIGFDTYRTSHIAKSHALLYRSTQVTSDSDRQARLQEVIANYPRTNASLWAQVELAHLERKAGKLEEALADYGRVYDRLAKDSPLTPLVLLALGQTNEVKGDLDQAASFYEKLASLPGYALLGKSGQARVHEARQQWKEARDIYEALEFDEQTSASDKAWIAAKLATLPATGAKK